MHCGHLVPSLEGEKSKKLSGVKGRCSQVDQGSGLLKLNFFNTSMLGLVTNSNLIQIYIFGELAGMCSYLLIELWFT